jgi:hypothetical protein
LTYLLYFIWNAFAAWGLVSVNENGDHPMANTNQNNPGMQNEGSKPDLDELTRRAEKEQEEKRKRGGTDSIKTVEGGGLADGVPFGVFPPSK